MVIKHKINTNLEDAYYNILWRVQNAGLNYETENHIIPVWNPNARDEYGNQYPKPDPDSVGTGTAWIKIIFKDRKQVFVYFCCHLVECKTCTYDRFITVYNYTDDIGDTNLQGMLPWLTLKYYGDMEPGDSDRTVYFKIKQYEYSKMHFSAPTYKSTSELPCNYVDKAGNPCVNGIITSTVTLPRGNDNTYIPAPTIEVKTICPKCNGTGKRDTIIPIVEGGMLTFYEFYVKTTDLYTEYKKITDFNTEVYIEPNTYRPLNTLDAVYDLIERTKAENEKIDDPSEKVDLSKYIFPIPVFKQDIIQDPDTGELSTNWVITDYRYYQTNYVDKDGKLIPLKAYVYWFPYTPKAYDLADKEVYNKLGVSDYVILQSYGTTSQTDVLPDDNYKLFEMYKSGGIKNFIKHCGEIETNNGTIHTPLIKTFTDTSDTEKIWNFICCKDKNLPIFPFSNNTLYISETSHPFEVNLYKNDNLVFKNILAQKTAANHSPLDAAIIKSTDEKPSSSTNHVYPIDYFYGTTNINSSDTAQYLELTNASNNSTLAYRNGYGDTITRAGDFNAIPGLTINNYTKLLTLSFKLHITIPEDAVREHISPKSEYLTLYNVNISYFDIDENGYNTSFEKHVATKYFTTNIKDVVNTKHYDENNEVCYIWPTSYTAIISFTINESEHGSILDFPFKDKRICVSLTRNLIDEDCPYDYNKINATVELSALTNITPIWNRALTDYDTNINLLPKIEYNYNNYPEGVFNYYHNLFDTSIENYIFYKYENDQMSREKTEAGITLIPDTIESQKKYSGFLNLMYQRKLRSIYTKQDSRKDYFTCPICQGDDTIKCDFCGGKRKLKMYDYNKNPNYDPNNAANGPEVLVRYPCPDLDKIDHEQGGNCHNRCRICAGTKSMIRYYYYNALEFKNLTEYNGKNPVDIPNLSNLDPTTVPPGLNIVERVLTATVKEKGSKTKEPYLNYLLRKYYSIPVEGSELDFDTYYEYYNTAINNTVFYVLNGTFTSYYYWTGTNHIKVDYGYNYIYAIKNVDRKIWDHNESMFNDSTVLYRVISEAEDVDNMIGFYMITEPDVTVQDTNFANARVQRVYFDKNWVYTNLLNDMSFNKFNVFTESKHDVVGKTQQLVHKDPYTGEETTYVHIHDETDPKLVDTRCTTCNGTGVDPNNEDNPCPLCGGSGDYPDDLQPEVLTFDKAVYAYSSSEYINTDNISFEVDDQVSVDDLVIHEG